MSSKGIIIIIASIVILAGGFVVYNRSNSANQTDETGSNDSKANINSTSLKSGPSIEVTPDLHDFGEVIYGEVASKTFRIKNQGDKNLEILKISTSCGCTKATVAESDKIIPSGQSADMLVTFDPAVHKDDSDLGSVVRVVYIKTNDPENPEMEVEIKAKVVKDS